MSVRLRAELGKLTQPDEASAAAVRSRSENVLRPRGALQRFDDVAIHIAAWQGTATPRIERPATLVFAADHGVAAAGVSSYPSEVTAAMLAAVQAGKATYQRPRPFGGVITRRVRRRRRATDR